MISGAQVGAGSRHAMLCRFIVALVVATSCGCRDKQTSRPREWSPETSAALKRCRDYHDKRRSVERKNTTCRNPFFPDWRDGQSWVVKLTRRKHYLDKDPFVPPGSRERILIVEYRLVDDDWAIDGHPVYTLSMKYGGPLWDTPARIYIRKDTGTICLIGLYETKGQVIPYASPGVQAHMRVAIEYWGGMRDHGDFCKVAPDDAVAHVQDRDRERLRKKHGVKVSDDGILTEIPWLEPGRRNPISDPALQEIIFTKGKKGMVVRLIAKNRRSEMSTGIKGGIIFTEQRWELGKPWWSSAKKVAGRDAFITGELLCP